MENHLRDTIDDILVPKVEVNGLEVSGLTTLGMLSTFVSSQRLGFKVQNYCWLLQTYNSRYANQVVD